MNTRLFFCILLGLSILFDSCQQTETNKSLGISSFGIKIDTSDAKGTYFKIKQLNKKGIDTFYRNLEVSLSKGYQYKLLLSHLYYYKLLNGDDSAVEAFISKSKGFSYHYLAAYDSANYYFADAIRLYEKLKLPADLADAYFGIASNYVYTGDYTEAFKYRYKSLELYEQQNDANNINRVKSDLAIDYYYQKDFQKAIETAKACLNYYNSQKDQLMIAYNQSSLTTFYYNTKDYKQAIGYGDSSLRIRRELGNIHDIAESLNNLSLVYMSIEDWTKAAAMLKEAITLMQQSNDSRQLPIIKQNLANCIWKLGDVKEAEIIILAVIDEAHKLGQKDAIANAYRKLSSIYKDAKNYEVALKYYQKYKAWSDSLYNYDKANSISELNISYETKKKEQEILRLNSEKKLYKVTKIFYLISIFLIVVIAILAILFLSNRNRKNKLMIEKVMLELKANEKELYHFTENIISKNKFIEELESKLNTLTNCQQPETEQQNENFSNLYQFKILTEDDWIEFKQRFDKVYPGIISKLREVYPNIASGEERQFLLTKLNIDNKECANMLGISPDSVKKNRYRLKKRFNLSEPENLDEFVRNFK